MVGKRGLRVVEDVGPIWQLWEQLPPEWRGPIIGPGIDNWAVIGENGAGRLDLTGLPDVIAAEMAWMAHWQAHDGTLVSVRALNQFATILRHAIGEHHPFPSSVQAMDWATASALQGWYYAKRLARLPTRDSRARLRAVFSFARLALLARCHEGPWWQMDEWKPRCDPRIPLAPREPSANVGCSPGTLSVPWLRMATKWHLGTALESGTLRWATIRYRLPSLHRFNTWLTSVVGDPDQILGDPAEARQYAAAFARWTAQPLNRLPPDGRQRHPVTQVAPRLVNEDLRAVAELLEFLAANPVDARVVLGAGPWQRVIDLHAAAWWRQLSRVPLGRVLNDENYVDDHALARITAALPLLGLPRDQQMLITRGDGQQVTVDGLGDRQAMRMILLQILTGRRASEVRTCDADCIEPITDATISARTAGEQIMRFRYAQSKIDTAPDSILVDQEVASVIDEQRAWLLEHFPGLDPRHLFLQRKGNRLGDKPYSAVTYNKVLSHFSDIVQISDSAGRAVRLNHTHRFRHTKLTRLAELGLPIHVLQRYAGHATPTMTMHYVAQREEHAELAFLATVKLRADGTQLQLSREDHDSLHLFQRADRLLPHGWCLLPPLQTCNKGLP